ncbi:hypothetical protein B0H14DRAFT_2648051, partial [Mycena olivaceomarginata]
MPLMPEQAAACREWQGKGAHYNVHQAWQARRHFVICTCGPARAHYNGTTGTVVFKRGWWCSSGTRRRYVYDEAAWKAQIHAHRLQFCACDDRITHRQQLMRACWWPATVRDPSTCATFAVIRLFQNMNCLGKISAFHFLRSLELLTNADGLTPPLDRRRAFMYIVRQYRMMEMMKRAGEATATRALGGTAQGELVLGCRACPQPREEYGRGLGEGGLVENGGRSLVYFANRAMYKEFLRKHVNEDEISMCSGFQAMFLANAKRVKGLLRTTGVGGVTCARHNMWRPRGLGDLQHGERVFIDPEYDYLFLILSYDIACQYSKNFWSRMKGLPETMHIDPKKVSVWFKVPNFHILGHKWPCHSPYSFHWMWGAGMTNGEDVEQNWEFTNGAAGSTKMMGPGGRHAFLEGLFVFHNWMRTVSYRKVFSRRMARDLKEGRQHKEAFSTRLRRLSRASSRTWSRSGGNGFSIGNQNNIPMGTHRRLSWRNP